MRCILYEMYFISILTIIILIKKKTPGRFLEYTPLNTSKEKILHECANT
jgi:hypothetical protein